jgi:hypothetical protein
LELDICTRFAPPASVPEPKVDLAGLPGILENRDAFGGSLAADRYGPIRRTQATKSDRLRQQG